METDAVPQCSPVSGCITCADEGIEMRVLSLAADGLAACVDAGGRQDEVETALVAPVAAGDLVLVHAGVAIARLEREEAA
jgi:hydrogenase assembly chaperone HypC/HupF